MAELPPNGIYPDRIDGGLDAIVDSGRLLVDDEAFGPAGSSTLELPDGSTWEIDHLNPSALISLEAGADDPASNPLLIAAFGGDGAMRLADDVRSRPDRRRPGQGVGAGAQAFTRGRVSDQVAAEAGRLVRLTDIADDSLLDPFARLVAMAELVDTVPDAAVGALFDAAIRRLLGAVDDLAADVDEAWFDDLGVWLRRLE